MPNYPSIKNLKHICFDKDGTLTDVHLYWSDIIQKRALKILDYYGLPHEKVEKVAYAMGIDLKQKRIIPSGPVGYKPRNVVIEAAVNVLAALGVEATSEEISRIFADVDEDMQAKDDYQIRILDDVHEVLKTIKKRGMKVSIYTSDRSKNLEKIVQKLTLDEYVDAMVGGDEVQRPKPDAQGFERACERVSVPLANSVYVGDTLDDMKMAKDCASLAGYGITTGLCSKEQLQAQTPFVFKSLKEISDFLE